MRKYNEHLQKYNDYFAFDTVSSEGHMAYDAHGSSKVKTLYDLLDGDSYLEKVGNFKKLYDKLYIYDEVRNFFGKNKNDYMLDFKDLLYHTLLIREDTNE